VINFKREDEYKLFLNHAVGLTERRQGVTATYLSVNTAITAVLAFLFKDGQLSGWVEQVSTMALLAAGIYASALWRRLIRQHSILIGWWYQQLRDMESGVSEGSKWLTKEYNTLYSEDQGKAALGLTRHESGLTWLFTLLYLSFFIGTLLALIFQPG
jgi:hypothetical protein